jgi:hypothetical protein
VIPEVLFLIALCATSQAALLRVPTEYSTIQAAIDDANDGNIALVAPGTYTGDGNRDIDFKGKLITVKSENGPEACIIDSQGTEDNPHRGFFFHSSEDANSILEGFTITNGYTVYATRSGKNDATMGGGIYCDASSPRINNCIVSENAAWLGGGITCKDSNAVITDCVIIGNRAVISKGGGIYCEGASPRILDCLITENNAIENGSGIECNCANPTIKHCIIRNNTTYKGGGGVRIEKVSGIDQRGQPLLFEMTNCLITGNTGCGIVANIEMIISNCTIFGNRGGGIYFGVVPRRVNNLIIYGNIGSEIAIGPTGAGGCRPGAIRITHSVVGSNPDAITARSCYSGEWLHADPLFVNPGYWDTNGTLDDSNDDFWVEGDYHLKSQAGRWDADEEQWSRDDVTSPCIDAGDPNSPIGHEPFPNGGIINIGAYGGTAEASKSYFGGPVCETIIAGDINGDCKVDFDDLMILMAHWLEDNTP